MLPFCSFSLGLLMAWLREGRVKTYNVKMLKTELARGTPKLCRNQKSFFDTFKLTPRLMRGGLYFSFSQQSVFLKHPSVHPSSTLLLLMSYAHSVQCVPSLPHLAAAAVVCSSCLPVTPGHCHEWEKLDCHCTLKHCPSLPFVAGNPFLSPQHYFF